MFDYTKTVVEKIKNDFVALIKLFQFATQILYLIYLAYALIRGTGILWVNITLLILSLAFLGYSIYMLTQEKPNKQMNKRIKRIIAWCKRVIKLYPLGYSVRNFNRAYACGLGAWYRVRTDYLFPYKPF